MYKELLKAIFWTSVDTAVSLKGSAHNQKRRNETTDIGVMNGNYEGHSLPNTLLTSKLWRSTEHEHRDAEWTE